MLASDLNNREFVGAVDPDSLLTVFFSVKPVENSFRSTVEGRPIFDDVDYIKIYTPGNSLNIIERPVNDDDKRRFSDQWRRYQAGKQGDEQISGTPLNQWALLSPAQAEELRHMGFRVVEQIAGASDDNILKVQNFAGMSGYALRERAKTFLAASKGEAEVFNRTQEVEDLKRQLAELQERLTAQETKRGPGRPAKVE